MLYINDGNGYFVKDDHISVLETAVPRSTLGPAAVADFNGDGCDDVYVVYYDSGVRNALFTNACNSMPGVLFSMSEPSTRTDKSYMAITCDFNNDGKPDIFVTNDEASNELLINTSTDFGTENVQVSFASYAY